MWIYLEDCQPLERIIIGRVKSGQIGVQLRHRAQVGSGRHHLGLAAGRSTGPRVCLSTVAVMAM